MGLDATVACNCYREGKTPATPFPEHVIFDEAGEPLLDLPIRSNLVEHEKFDAWKRTACPHRDMWLAFERIGNWASVGVFTDMLEVVGWDRFPQLKHELAESNSGITSAAHAQALLGDVERFMALPRLGEKACLIDVETGASIVEYMGHRCVHFMGRGAICFELDSRDFVVRRREPGEETGVELFRSRRFRQQLLETFEPEPARARHQQNQPRNFLRRVSHLLFGGLKSDPGPTGEFVDHDTGARFAQHMALRIDVPSETGQSSSSRTALVARYPLELRVDLRTAVPQDFEGVFQAIASVCRASIAAGNPIRWMD